MKAMQFKKIRKVATHIYGAENCGSGERPYF
jgi:hypothetical protein